MHRRVWLISLAPLLFIAGGADHIMVPRVIPLPHAATAGVMERGLALEVGPPRTGAARGFTVDDDSAAAGLQDASHLAERGIRVIDVSQHQRQQRHIARSIRER